MTASGSMKIKTSDVCGDDNFIGRSSFTWDSYLWAEMDEYRFWNYARSESQIALERKVRLSGNVAGLVAYYGFDEGGGSMVYDASVNKYDLPMYGSVGWVRSSAPILMG